MQVARDSGPSEEQLVRYLLGQLPAEAAERLDEASIVVDDVAARLREVEDDLVDRYVVDALDGQTRDRFEQYYLTTTRRREKVEFARRFLAGIDRAAAPQRRRTTPKVSNLVWPLVAVAASLLIASGVLVVNNVQLRTALGTLQRERAETNRGARALEAQLAAARDAATQAQNSANQNASNADAATPRSSDRGSGGVPHVAALLLLPQRRSLESAPTIAASADERIVLQLRLETNDFERYQVVLTDSQTTRVMWRSGMLQARTAGSLGVVAVDIPAAGLDSRRYSLELSGAKSGGGAEAIATYAFELERR